MSRQVLMCGGPADGRWVVVPDERRSWDVITLPVLSRVDWTREVPDTGVPVTTTYRIYQEDLFGQGLWVGVPVDQAYDDRRLIMKAVLQRDVAAHLGAYR